MLEFLQLLVYIMGISNNVIKAVDDGDDSSYRLCLGIRAMDNSSNLLIVQNLDSTERIGISHS